uniref:DC_STAMP domain-containing protein n=1 Tax=Haemonchus contortus TaxID=6289 RepID=A0A7I4Y6T2_HAECO
MGSKQPPPPVHAQKPIPRSKLPMPSTLPEDSSAPQSSSGTTHTPQRAQSPTQKRAHLPQDARPTPPAVNPPAQTPKSMSGHSPAKSPPRKAVLQLATAGPRSNKVLAPTPKLSSPKSGRKQQLPCSAPGTPRRATSPVPQGGMIRLKRVKSVPDTAIAGTPAISAPSEPAVEFVPPTEYVDMSRIAIRSVQLLFVGELCFHLIATSYGLLYTELFLMFKKTFSLYAWRAALIAPAALTLAAILTIRTIFGIFAINFTLPSANRTLYRLIALFIAHIIYGLVLVAAGNLFQNIFNSDEVRETVMKNLAHLIRFATKDDNYMKEVNRLQQKFKCCGMKGGFELNNGTYTNSDHPWNIWYDSYSLDETYPNVIRELYSLPWSCCNLTSGMKCEHIGISRYQRNFANPTDFNDVETALNVFELRWNPTSYEHYLDRNKQAIGTLYDRDCSEQLIIGLEENASLIENLMFRAGIVLLAFSVPLLATVIHVYITLRSISPQAAPTPSAASK